MQIRTRREAFENGLKRYFTGKHCLKGHLTFRYTTTGACVGCIRGYTQQYRVQYQTNVKAHQLNLKVVTYRVHPDDEQALTRFAEALAAARLLTPDYKTVLMPAVPISS